MERKDIYSIRKSKVGTVSAKIAAVMFLSLAGGVVANTTSNNVAQAAEEIKEKTEETTIKSPVEYIADPTKEVGVREEKTTGTDGKISLKIKDGNQTIERTEATKTEVALGTKPKEETTLEKAKTEYVEDKELEGGKKEVIKEAKDGEKTTTTTYKIITEPKTKLDKKVEEALKSDKYMYTDEKIYSIDNTKELPSDKIVIDKLFVKVPEKQSLGEATSARELVHSSYTLFSPDTGKNVNYSGKYAGYKFTPEMLDPNNSDIRAIKYEVLPTSLPGKNEKKDFSLDSDLYEVLLEKSYNYLAELATGKHIENLLPFGKENTTETAAQRYFAKNILTDSLYADAKANYLRMKLAESKLGTLNEYQKNEVEWGERLFQGITRHYNYLNGSDSLKITYEGNIPENVKKEFEEAIQKIPYEYRRNLVSLFVTDKELTATHKLSLEGLWAAGLAYPTRDIFLKYYTESNGNKINQPITMLMTLLHEIGHVVDANAGTATNYKGAANVPGAAAKGIIGFRETKEFEDIYNKYFKGAKPYPTYYTNNIEETFAEHLGRYVFKRAFGREYPKYIEQNGKEVRIYPEDARYASAFTPMDNPEVEYYFATLYNKLFEQPTEAKVVIDTVKSSTKEVQNGLVKVGTKPKEEKIITPFTTTTKLDSTLAEGEKKVLQAGVNGEVLKRTTYTLNKETGNVTEATSENIIKKMVEEIILVGTKKEEAKIETKETLRTEEVPYKTIEQNDPSLEKGQRVTKVVGVKGKKVYKTTQTLKDGKVIDTKEVLLSEEAPKDEVVLVGAKEGKPNQTTKRVEVREEKIPYTTITKSNPNLPIGQTRLIKNGANGSFKVVRDDVYEGNTLIKQGAEYIVDKVEAIDEIIEIGTKQQAKEKQEPKQPEKEENQPPKLEDNTLNKTEDKREKETKTVVHKEMVKAKSNQKQLPKTSSSSESTTTLGLIALVGAAVAMRRKKVSK